MAERVLPLKEERGLAALIGSALANSELADKIGAGVLGVGFEAVAHNAIGGVANGQGSGGRPFSMAMLGDGGDGKVSRRKGVLKFDFLGRMEFAGVSFPDALYNGVYYKPTADNFEAIDSVGVDTAGETLYFFQMKPKSVVRVNGAAVEKYWNSALASNAVSTCVFT